EPAGTTSSQALPSLRRARSAPSSSGGSRRAAPSSASSSTPAQAATRSACARISKSSTTTQLRRRGPSASRWWRSSSTRRAARPSTGAPSRSRLQRRATTPKAPCAPSTRRSARCSTRSPPGWIRRRLVRSAVCGRPAAAERAVELHRGQALVQLGRVEVELRSEELALRVEHLEEADDAVPEAKVRKAQRVLRHCDAATVDLGLAPVAVEGHQRVRYLLQREQHRAPVADDRLLRPRP